MKFVRFYDLIVYNNCLKRLRKPNAIIDSIHLRNYSKERGIKRAKKKTIYAHSPAFYEKIKIWRELLKGEVRGIILNALKANCAEETFLGPLRLKSLKLNYCLSGTIAEFDFLSRNNNNISSVFKKGTPVFVCHEEGAEIISECYFISLINGNISVLITDDKFRYLNLHSNYIIIPGLLHDALENLESLIKKREWEGMPGERILHFMHRSLEMPFPHLYSKPLKSVINENLNKEQKNAVGAALDDKFPLVAICGPPGTGKTHVVEEIIQQAIKLGKRILVCAASNLAVENIYNRLKDKSVVYLHSLNASLSENSLSENLYLYKKSEHMNEINWAGTSISEAFNKCRKIRKSLLKNTISKKQVIFCTLTSKLIHSFSTSGFKPDLTIIDEVAQAMECVTYPALLQAPRVVLVGDQNQLCAILRSPEAEKGGLGQSILEFLMKEFGKSFVLSLNIQYRMNEKIMRWSSAQFYGSNLVAHATVAKQTLSDISNIPSSSYLNEPMIIIDTAFDHKSREIKTNLSYSNRIEANIVLRYIHLLLNYGVKETDIGVIAPYRAQVSNLRKLLPNSITVDTVDGFQGQERQVIVMSLVRTNALGKVGFLNEKRRLNVAVTRARRQFVLVGNSTTMKMADSEYLYSLLEYITIYGTTIAPSDVIEFDKNIKISSH